jgi:hypothetical protein
MRSLKFAIYFGLLGGAWALGWPRFALVATLLASPAAYAPEVPTWALWLPLGAGLLVYSLVFTLAAVRRWELGLVHHAAVIVLFGAVLLARMWGEMAWSADGGSTPEVPPAFRLSQAAARLDAGLQTLARARGAAPVVYPAARTELEGLLSTDGALPLSGFRRHGWPDRLVLRVIPDAAGPVLVPQPGDGAGTLYVALSSNRARYWITLVGLSRYPTGEPTLLLAEEGAPFVLASPTAGAP